MVSGESARETFFTAKGLDLTEGFKILSGAVYNSRLTILNIPLTPFVFFSDSHGTRRHVQPSNGEDISHPQTARERPEKSALVSA